MNNHAKGSRRGPQSRRTAQHGIVLIEALIAMLIFAFGVLGLVGLQASMTQAQSSSKFRADAANLAAELFALVQTDNLANLALYSTDGCAGYARCADWVRKVEATLPAGDVSLATNAGSGTIDLTVSWQQSGHTSNSFQSSMVWQQ